MEAGWGISSLWILSSLLEGACIRGSGLGPGNKTRDGRAGRNIWGVFKGDSYQLGLLSMAII